MGSWDSRVAVVVCPCWSSVSIPHRCISILYHNTTCCRHCLATLSPPSNSPHSLSHLDHDLTLCLVSTMCKTVLLRPASPPPAHPDAATHGRTPTSLLICRALAPEPGMQIERDLRHCRASSRLQCTTTEENSEPDTCPDMTTKRKGCRS
jgi:hypothetical protein